MLNWLVSFSIALFGKPGILLYASLSALTHEGKRLPRFFVVWWIAENDTVASRKFGGFSETLGFSKYLHGLR